MIPSRPSLILIGHGSSSSKRAKVAIEEHANTLRLSPRFGTVQTYFLMDEGRKPEIPLGEVFLLPFFMSDGYFVQTKVPSLFNLVNFQRLDENFQIYQCDALGVDQELAQILNKMAQEVRIQNELDEANTAVVLIAHGSQKNPASARAARLQCEQFVKLSNYAFVDVAFLEQEPSISQCLDTLSGKAENVICLGLFAADGPHAIEDVPAEIQCWQKRNVKVQSASLNIFYKGAVGVRSEVVKLIQDSVSRRANKILR